MKCENHFLFKLSIKMTISTTTKNTFPPTATIWQNINIQWISTWSCWQRKISSVKWNLCSFFFFFFAADKWQTHVTGTTDNEDSSARLPLLRSTTKNIKHDTLTVRKCSPAWRTCFSRTASSDKFCGKKEMISRRKKMWSNQGMKECLRANTDIQTCLYV